MLLKRIAFILAYLVTILLLPHPVFAQITMPDICGVGKSDIAEFISQFLVCGTSLVSGIGVLFIIYGGYLLVLSGGDPNKVRIGKEYITYAILGIVLAIFTILTFEIIGVDVLNLPGFHH